MPGRRRPDWDADRDLREGINALDDETAAPQQSGQLAPNAAKKRRVKDSEDIGEPE